MRAADARLDELLGPGAVVFRASMELLADPVSVLWAVRDAASCIIDFEVVYANAAMARLFGVSIEDSVGRRLVQESPAFAREPVFDRMRGAVETGVPVLVESVVESRPGPIAPLSGVFLHRAVPFGPDAVMNLLTDITAQRRLESELEAFAQVAAHDVREPLMAIGLFVEQLASGLDRGRVERNEQLVELLRRTQARAKLLVDGILEYARYGRGADIDEVDMGVVVADVVSSLSATVAATKATIEVAELPTIRGDARQLSRVVQNLLANSLKYRSEALPRVRIAAERADGFWLFTVADNGVGIPPELGDNAFAMFKRAGAGDDASCGIGLAVCRRIIETHGGVITAAPVTEGGTAIRFSLPG